MKIGETGTIIDRSGYMRNDLTGHPRDELSLCSEKCSG